MSMEVMVGNFGVTDVDAPDREFDLVEFTSLPCDHGKSKSNKTDHGFELKEGEKVVDVKFWKELEKSGSHWCVPGTQTAVAVARMSNTLDFLLSLFHCFLAVPTLPVQLPSHSPSTFFF